MITMAKQKRIAHELGARKTTLVPNFHIFTDTETLRVYDKESDLWFHTLRMGTANYYVRDQGITDGFKEDKGFMYRTVNEFWDWVMTHLRSKQYLNIWTHNCNFRYVNS